MLPMKFTRTKKLAFVNNKGVLGTAKYQIWAIMSE